MLKQILLTNKIDKKELTNQIEEGCVDSADNSRELYQLFEQVTGTKSKNILNEVRISP